MLRARGQWRQCLSAGNAAAVNCAQGIHISSGRPLLCRSLISKHRGMATRAAPAAASHAAEGAHKHTNRLAAEQSPYLLQHAHNPVDWYPWGPEAFEAAKSQNKPIFLSVGYATCHWCHVMERESFESEEAAALMNKHFINVKVDREERPDVDRVYMTYVQATTGGGGWPMSVWLTPDLKPFYGGTYYPSKDAYGMPSFTTVLKRIAQLWGSRQDDLQEQANDIMKQLQEFTSGPAAAPAGPGSAAADPAKLAAAVAGCAKALSKGFDAKLGGFGGPPKFPRPSEINLLLRAAQQAASAGPAAGSKASSAAPSAQLLLGMCLFSLQAMAAGGMYDALGGGFHRYSVDEFWHVPHFEKMCYDNPQLALTYLDAFRITLAARRAAASSSSASGNDGSTPAAAAAAVGGGRGLLTVDDEKLGDPGAYAGVVRGVLDYLRRDMTHPDGGLYSAEDADSLDPATNSKSEGVFYVWTSSEVEEVLGPERAALFNEIYGVKAEGNATLSARSDPHNEFGGKNVLMQFTRPQPEQQQVLGECRKLLYDRRAQRPRPALDDKVVTAWNSQGISAFALASRVLAAEQPPATACFPVDGCAPSAYLQAAVEVANFLKQHVWDADSRRLRRAYCNAPSAVEGFADDYALLIAGLLDLYEAGGGLAWLQWALQLQDTLDELFWDEAGGYFQSSGADPSIQLRLKEDYDGAEPAASSIAAANLIRLAALLPAGESPSSSSSSSAAGQQPQSFAARADAVLAAFMPRLERVGIAMPQMCAAAWLRTRLPLRQVIIAGKAASPATSALLDAAHAAWAPDKCVIVMDPTDPESVGFWNSANPAAWAMVESHYARSSAAAVPAAATAGSAAGPSEVAAAGGADGGFVPTAFVCQNYTCQAPTISPDRLYELLSAAGGGGGAVKLTPVKL